MESTGLIEIDKQALVEVDEQIITDNIYDVNRAWKERWYNYFAGRFRDSELFKELQDVSKEKNYLASKINSVIDAYNKLLEENIELGETNEALNSEVKDLRKKVGSIPSGFFDVAGKLVKKNLQNHFLNEENKKLKEKAQHPLNKIEPDKVEQVLILKAKGFKYADIAKKTGVSNSSISRYVSNNRGRLGEIERALKEQ